MSMQTMPADRKQPATCEASLRGSVGVFAGAFVVAQIFNLQYRRIAFGTARDRSETEELCSAGRLQIRDTAGCKPALRSVGGRTTNSNSQGGRHSRFSHALVCALTEFR